MPEIQTGQAEDILTLAEAAAYLRVPEAELLRLVEEHDIPAQKIGSEWRFLKKALSEWLRYGRAYFREYLNWPLPWMIDHPVVEELLFLLEKRLLNRLNAQQPERGSKQAVLKHFGVFKEDADLENTLASIQARRKAAEG